jgi:hypothetical protein
MTPSIRAALKRWVQKGLLEPEKAQALAREVEEDAKGREGQWAQYLLAATGGAVLIVAASTFLAWVWPDLGYPGQTVTLGAIGLALLALGIRLPKKGRLGPVAYLLQLAATVLVIMAFVHSEKAWADGSLAGWIVGLLALAMPFLLMTLAIKDRGMLAGLQASLSFVFLFLFMDRALGLSEEPVLWILDGILLGILAFLAFTLRDREVPDWVLGTFFTLLLSSIILIAISSEVIWDLEDSAIYPMDLWLLTVAGLCIWGSQPSTPNHLKREWYLPLLALCVLVAIPFGFITTLETLDTGPTAAALTVAAIGVAGLAYSLPRGVQVVAATSCVALLVAAWYWGAEMSGALGAVFALLAVSIVLFWGATRLGKTSGQRPKGVE